MAGKKRGCILLLIGSSFEGKVTLIMIRKQEEQLFSAYILFITLIGIITSNRIGHFGKYHNILCLSPQILHKHCFQFLLGLIMVPRENKNNAYAKFGGTKKEYYGIFRTGLFFWNSGCLTAAQVIWLCACVRGWPHNGAGVICDTCNMWHEGTSPCMRPVPATSPLTS